MTLVCPNCAASMPDSAGFCPGCGRGMAPVARAKGMVGVLPETLAGALSYFLLPAIVFLLVEPYKTNRFVRFHALQFFGVLLSALAVGAILRLASVLLFFIPTIGPLLISLLSMLVVLAFLMIWIVLVVKALQGERFKLPWVGELAEQKAAIV